MKKPSISVIVPCHNGARYLHQALQSIENQGWPFEIILIDDGSTDESSQIISEYYPTVRYYYKDNSSPAAARNMGIRLATYDLLSFLDVDDQWTNEKTQMQTALFQDDHTLDVAGGLVDYLVMPESQYRGSQFSDKPVHHTLLSTLLVKREVFEKIGTFDETLRLGEDLDWFLRLKESNLSYRFVNKVVLNYRIHEDSLTARKTVRDLGTTEVIRKALERKRAVNK